jgi:hypothetical protein
MFEKILWLTQFIKDGICSVPAGCEESTLFLGEHFSKFQQIGDAPVSTGRKFKYSGDCSSPKMKDQLFQNVNN